jgi:hypothetical protein
MILLVKKSLIFKRENLTVVSVAVIFTDRPSKIPLIPHIYIYIYIYIYIHIIYIILRDILK